MQLPATGPGFGNTSMQTNLTFLPSDILRLLFDFLDDEDLASLGNVCHVTRTISLVVLLTRYRSLMGWDERVRLSSPVIAELGDNLRTITTLTYRPRSLWNAGVLNSVVASLPKLERLVVPLYGEPWLLYWRERAPSLLSIVTAFIARSPSDRFNWVLLKQEHRGSLLHGPVYGTLKWNEDFDISRFKRMGAEFCTWTSFHVQSIPAASASSTNYTLVVLNPLEMTWLSLGCEDIERECGTAIMKALHLPKLEVLAIRENCRLSISDLFGFLSRHPTIQSLWLGNRALAKDSLEQLKQSQRAWPLPNITSLGAPVPYMLTIANLKDCDAAARLKHISFGVPTRGWRFLHALRWFSLPSEEKISFKHLDEVLQGLRTANPDVTIHMNLSRFLTGSKWKKKRKDEGIP